MTIDIQGVITDLEGAVLDAKTGFAEQATLISYLSVNNDDLSAANIALQAQLDTARAENADLKAKLEALQPKPTEPVVKTVKDYGAKGDGVTDDTAEIQAAFNAGVYVVPAGRYLIDASKPLTVSKAGAVVEMDPEAILVCKPNSLPRYYVMRATGDVTIKGGQIIGDRLKHTYTAGSTHEWGYGLFASGDVVVDGLKVSECTGDGIGVSGNVTLRNVVCTKNRRQGLSAFSCKSLKVYDSEFSLTGALLTDGAAPNGPCAGVDIEPDSAYAVTAHFERCKFNGNRAGFLAWLRSEVGGTINATLVDCEMVGNANGSHAKALAGKINVDIKGGNVTNNRGSGLRIESGAEYTVNGVTFDLSGDRTDFTLAGMDSRTRYDINVLTGGKANVGTNKYV